MTTTLKSHTLKAILPGPGDWEDYEGLRDYRSRLGARFQKGIKLPIVPVSCAKSRAALSIALGVLDLKLAGLPLYDVRAEEWVGGFAQTVTTARCFPKKESKSENIGNSCATAIRRYCRTFGEFGTDWESLAVVSVADDSPLVVFVWVD